MAALSRSRRSAAGIAFIVGGALVLLRVVLTAAAATGVTPWVSAIAFLAIAAGLGILAIGSIANVIARIALIVAAIGWVLLAFGVGAFAFEFGTFAAVLASLGGVVGAIVLYTGKEITDRSAIAFIATTIAVAIYLLVPTAGIAELAVLLAVIVGIGFIVTGVLFHWVRRGRR